MEELHFEMDFQNSTSSSDLLALANDATSKSDVGSFPSVAVLQNCTAATTAAQKCTARVSVQISTAGAAVQNCSSGTAVPKYTSCNAVQNCSKPRCQGMQGLDKLPPQNAYLGMQPAADAAASS